MNKEDLWSCHPQCLIWVLPSAHRGSFTTSLPISWYFTPWLAWTIALFPIVPDCACVHSCVYVCVLIVTSDVDSQVWLLEGVWKWHNCVFSPQCSRYNAENEDISSRHQESAFMLFSTWRNLRRLKLEGLKCIRSGSFFMQVSVICMMTPWYIIGIGG